MQNHSPTNNRVVYRRTVGWLQELLETIQTTLTGINANLMSISYQTVDLETLINTESITSCGLQRVGVNPSKEAKLKQCICCYNHCV